jgi:hypothetical protein
MKGPGLLGEAGETRGGVLLPGGGLPGDGHEVKGRNILATRDK